MPRENSTLTIDDFRPVESKPSPYEKLFSDFVTMEERYAMTDCKTIRDARNKAKKMRRALCNNESCKRQFANLVKVHQCSNFVCLENLSLA